MAHFELFESLSPALARRLWLRRRVDSESNKQTRTLPQQGITKQNRIEVMSMNDDSGLTLFILLFEVRSCQVRLILIYWRYSILVRFPSSLYTRESLSEPVLNSLSLSYYILFSLWLKRKSSFARTTAGVLTGGFLYHTSFKNFLLKSISRLYSYCDSFMLRSIEINHQWSCLV